MEGNRWVYPIFIFDVLIIVIRIGHKGFPYVLGLPTPSRIGFGYASQRPTWDQQWMCSPLIAKSITSTKSQSRRTLIKSSLPKKPTSTYGHAAFVSRVPRLADSSKKHTVDVGTYDVEHEKSFKANYTPFNSSTALQREPKFVTPGPPTYPYHEKLPNYNYCLAFGKRRLIWPATAIFCSIQNTAKCFYCQQKPEGDFLYNFKTKLSLCRRCFKRQYMKMTECSTEAMVRILKMRELNEFKPVRHCDFYHTHLNGKVSRTLIPKTQLRKKIQTENYLYLYQPLWYKKIPMKDLVRKF